MAWKLRLSLASAALRRDLYMASGIVYPHTRIVRDAHRVLRACWPTYQARTSSTVPRCVPPVRLVVGTLLSHTPPTAALYRSVLPSQVGRGIIPTIYISHTIRSREYPWIALHEVCHHLHRSVGLRGDACERYVVRATMLWRQERIAARHRQGKR